MSEGCTYFMSKIRLENERQHTQQCLDTVAGILRHFMPHFQYVRRILNARVPIVKFRHAGCEVECDLCLSNRWVSCTFVTYGCSLYLFRGSSSTATVTALEAPDPVLLFQCHILYYV